MHAHIRSNSKERQEEVSDSDQSYRLFFYFFYLSGHEVTCEHLTRKLRGKL